MRADDHAKLGALISEATKWRNTGKGAGIEIAEINARMPDGAPITLRWREITNEVRDEETQEMTYPIVWEGWVISTAQF